MANYEMANYEDFHVLDEEVPHFQEACSGVLSDEQILAPGTPPVPKKEPCWVHEVRISDLEDKSIRQKRKLVNEREWSDRLAQQNSRFVGESRDLRAELKRTREELEKSQALSTERGQWIATVMEIWGNLPEEAKKSKSH